MSYQALYRKWRPLTFHDVIGQSHITTTLANEVKSGKTAHAYLFCGTRGTGKTTCAKILSRAINCIAPKNGNPCNQCEICKGILDGSILDVTEIDAASNNGVDNIRQIRDEVIYTPSRGSYKVYIIDEVHMLSTGAFNALLKTLEEPPSHIIFILATTEVQKLPATIISRCQRFDFKRISNKDITIRLKQIATEDNIGASDAALELIARLADGGMRDALSILERCLSACPKNFDVSDITAVLGIADLEAIDIVAKALINKDIAAILENINKLHSDGRDLSGFMDSLARRFRDMLVYKVSDNNNLIDTAYSNEVYEQAKSMPAEQIFYILSVLNNALSQSKWQKNPRTAYELALIKICTPSLELSIEAILDRISAIEKQLSSGIKVKETKQPNLKTQTAKEPKEEKAEEAKGQPKALENTKPKDTNNGVDICIDKWSSVLEILKKSNLALFAQLLNRHPIAKNSNLVLNFNSKESMIKKIIEMNNNLESLKSALKEVSGEDINVLLEIDGEPSDYDPLSEIESKLGSIVKFE